MASSSRLHQDGLRDPSQLFYQGDNIRRSILASYWLVILFAVPLWWSTTSIERLSLPSSRVSSQSHHHLQLPIRICLGETEPSLAIQLQQYIDERVLRAPYRWKGLDVHVTSKNEAGSYTVIPGTDFISVKNRQLSFPTRPSTLSNLADTLSALLVPLTASEHEHRVAHYSPRYRLAFTLLDEDASVGESVTGWDVSDAISRHVSPILDSLSILHNFTVESQVQFHAPLAFRPRELTDQAYGLTPEDLTVFVNSAEWTLSSSVSNDPVLHFILFVPSVSQRPLHILNKDGTLSSSNAFLLPQWGGIVILNPNPKVSLSNTHLSATHLDPIFSAFSHQLLTLLGVPPLPSGVHASSDASVLTDWQLDALLRRRALENAQGTQDTLTSIIKLVDQIKNMPVGQDVKGDVQDSLTALDQMYASSQTSLPESLYHSACALTLASRAFFNPGMLALLYFPAEHKYAVYTPLFASAVIPLFVAALRELVAWRKQRMQRAQKPTKSSVPPVQ